MRPLYYLTSQGLLVQARWPAFTLLPVSQEYHPTIRRARHLLVSTRGIAQRQTATMQQVDAVALGVPLPNPADMMGMALGLATKDIVVVAHTSEGTIGRMEHTSGATLGVGDRNDVDAIETTQQKRRFFIQSTNRRIMGRSVFSIVVTLSLSSLLNLSSEEDQIISRS